MGIGSQVFRRKMPGLPSSPPTPVEWRETLNVVTNDADFTTRTKCRMEAPKKRRAMTTPMTDMTTMTNTDDDVPPTTICDTTPKIPASEPSRSPPDSPSGPSATSETARDRKTTSSRSTEWTDGTTDSADSSDANKSCTNSI